MSLGIVVAFKVVLCFSFNNFRSTVKLNYVDSRVLLSTKPPTTIKHSVLAGHLLATDRNAIYTHFQYTTRVLLAALREHPTDHRKHKIKQNKRNKIPAFYRILLSVCSHTVIYDIHLKTVFSKFRWSTTRGKWTEKCVSVRWERCGCVQCLVNFNI